MLVDTSDLTYVLFMDLDEVESASGLKLCLNAGEKHAENPLLRPTPGAWDRTSSKCYGTVLYDGDQTLFRLWYSGASSDRPEDWIGQEGGGRRIGYAISQDGVHWTKPSLGIVEYDGSRQNNLVWYDGQAPNVYVLDRDPPYWMYFESGVATNDLRLAASEDGLHWQEVPESPLIGPKFAKYPGVHEPYSVLYDPDDPDPARRWKVYSLLHWSKEPGVTAGRSVGLWMSADGISWTEHPQNPIMSAEDGPEHEIHLPAVFRYRGYYLMFRDYMYINNATDTELALSRDGISFSRVESGQKLIPLGQPGDWDSGMICLGPRSFLEHDGKLWYYYAGSPDTYREGPRSGAHRPWNRYTGLAQWRIDGLAHLEARDASGEGSFVTVPIPVAGKPSELVVNADCSGAGSEVTAEVVDAATNRPVAGRSFAECDPVRWDGTAIPVRWQGEPFGLPGANAIKLSFKLRGQAKLHSFRFRGSCRS